MAKLNQPVTQIKTIPFANSTATLTLRELKLLIVETHDRSEVILRLSPSQDLQAFMVLLKETLPTIR